MISKGIAARNLEMPDSSPFHHWPPVSEDLKKESQHKWTQASRC